MSKNPNITGGFAQDYIDGLEQALKDAENILKVNNAYYNSAAFAFNEAKAWEDKLKRYWENIKKTEEFAQAIIDEIGKLDQQTVCVCHNAADYREAVKILLCCVKEVAIMLEAMSDEFTKLWTRIDCVKSKEPALDTSKSILKYLLEFKAKMDATLKSSLDALKACLGLMRAASLMLDKKKALRSYIDWLQRAGQIKDNNTFVEIPNNRNDECQPEDTSEPPCKVDYTPPCISIEIPCPSLEINCSEYYSESETSYISAVASRKTYKEELDKAQKVRDGALTKRDAAIKAFNDAKAAKQCK